MSSEKPVRPLHTLAYGETAMITSMYLHWQKRCGRKRDVLL